METPGGAATSSNIPLEEVLGVVTLPAEAVIPYPGVCSKIRLHNIGGADRGTPTHLQCGSGLQQQWQNPTPVAVSSSWSKVTTLGCKQLLSLGGSACRLATMSWTKAAQSDRLIPMRSVRKPPWGAALPVGGGMTRREQAHKTYTSWWLRGGSSWKGAQKVLIYLPAPLWVCIACGKDSQRESSLDCILMYSHLQQSRYELTHD